MKAFTTATKTLANSRAADCWSDLQLLDPEEVERLVAALQLWYVMMLVDAPSITYINSYSHEMCNIVTSAALDCGLIVATVIIFLTLQLTNAQPPQWFGNIDVMTNLDQTGKAISMTVADGQTFGPTTWK